MAYIAALDFDRWENHNAYYKIWVKNCNAGERYYNCVYHGGKPKNQCGHMPSDDEYAQECYVAGRLIDYGGQTYTIKLWLGRCDDGEYEDSEELFIPSDPDTCETQCQTSCESSCQSSCESSCQSYCQQACQSTCQLTCQTACETVGQFCGRDCGRSVGR